MTRALLGLLLGVAMLTAPSLASAEQDPAKANALFKKAKAKLDAGEPEEALTLVSKAAGYFQHPAIFLLKAKTLRELGRLGQALEVLEQISTRKLPRGLRKVRGKEIAEIKAAMKTRGRVRVTVEPDAAVVEIGGKRYRGGLDTWLPEGRHKLEIHAKGHVPTVRNVEVSAGGTTKLRVVLRAAVGRVRLVVDGGLKGVQVKVDGAERDVPEGKRAGDVVTLELPIGKHEVACSRGSLLELHKVEVALGKTAAVRCAQIRGSSRIARLSLGWGGVAAGLALAGYGAWGLQSYFADLEKAEQQGLIADTNKHYGGALYLASGLAIGVTSYLLFVREGSSSEATALVPTPGEERARVTTILP